MLQVCLWMLIMCTSCQGASISFIGVVQDITDYSNLGKEGFWFPAFGCSSYAFEQPTNYSEYNGLKEWAGPLKHIMRWELKEYINRSFSMDGPCSSIGGGVNFSMIIPPNETTHRPSGIIVDPAAEENSNNSVNRIALNEGTPSSFILSIMVDNCNKQHSSINRITARGEHLGESVEPDVSPSPGLDAFNGIPDLFQFQYDGFLEGDYIKIKFNGQSGTIEEGGGASFGGILFD